MRNTTLVLTRTRPKFERDYPGVAQELGLSRGEADRLFDLLAESSIASRAEIPAPKLILGGPTPDELKEKQDAERRTLEVLQASRRRQDESIQALLADKYALWQVYLEERAQVKRVESYESGLKAEERMRRYLEGHHLNVTADRPQREAWRQLQAGLEQVAAYNKRMEIELEREGLLPHPPQQ